MRRARAAAAGIVWENCSSGRVSRNGRGTITRVAGEAATTPDSRAPHGAVSRHPLPRSPAGRQQQCAAHMAQVPAAGAASAAA